MNSNLFQTILTAASLAATAVTTILLSLGCSQDAMGKLMCVATSAPTWLVPYLATIAMVLGVVKLIIATFTGKLSAPTAVVSVSGAPGTVPPSAIK